MQLTVRQAAELIDPLYPPTSVRTLLRRFRYVEIDPGDLPSGAVSVRAAIERLEDHSAAKKLLHYNCWLIDAKIELRDLVEAVSTDFARFLVCLGIDLTEYLARVLDEVDTSSICDVLSPPIVKVWGVSANPINDTCYATLAAAKGTGEFALWIVETIGKSVVEILDLMDVPLDILLKVLATVLDFHPAKSESQDKSARPFEIGGQVLPYDIISLVEVWDTDSQKAVLAFGNATLAGSDGNFETYKGRWFAGPDAPLAGSWKQKGSGLFVVVPTLVASDGGISTYQVDGVHRYISTACDFGMGVDIDRFANKGIQLTVVDLGLGKIDLYSTHLYSGGGGLDWPKLNLAKPSPVEMAQVRDAQIRQLAGFIGVTHDPRHVAIVAGDFNVNAQTTTAFDLQYPGQVPTTEYKNLLSVLGNIPLKDGANVSQFVDLWDVSAFDDILSTISAQGTTNRSAENHPDFASVCKVKAAVASLIPEALPNDFYCDDAQADDDHHSGDRIDYIFVEKPTVTHEFMLDVSRIRRRAFQRAVAGDTAYMSDHLGLEITLFPSVRP